PLAHVRHAIGVDIFEIPDVGRVGNQNAFLPAHYSGGHDELVRENGHTIRYAVAVGVLDHFDASQRIVGAERITAVFDDVHTAVLVDIHRHRGFDVGLREELFDVETGLDFECF